MKLVNKCFNNLSAFKIYSVTQLNAFIHIAGAT